MSVLVCVKSTHVSSRPDACAVPRRNESEQSLSELGTRLAHMALHVSRGRNHARIGSRLRKEHTETLRAYNDVLVSRVARQRACTEVQSGMHRVKPPAQTLR